MQALLTAEMRVSMKLPMRIPTLEDRLAVREKPASSPVMFQTWSNLLFLHWEIDVQEIAKRIPNRLSVDLHEGKTYLGLVPFFMKKSDHVFYHKCPGFPIFSN
jgi:uncharacterized protein YqjF (DUF2071 family)